MTLIIACSNLAASPTLEPWNMITSPKLWSLRAKWWAWGTSIPSPRSGTGLNCFSVLSYSCFKDGSLLPSGTTFHFSQGRVLQCFPAYRGCAFRENNHPWEPWHFLLSCLLMGSDFRIVCSLSYGEWHTASYEFASNFWGTHFCEWLQGTWGNGQLGADFHCHCFFSDEPWCTCQKTRTGIRSWQLIPGVTISGDSTSLWFIVLSCVRDWVWSFVLRLWL
jgi:hypothetical protein